MSNGASATLNHREVAEALSKQGLKWSLEGDELVREVKGRDFAWALSYVNQVGAAAEAANHHPDIAISWNTVTLRLSTHSAGGITTADLDMAATIDRLDR